MFISSKDNFKNALVHVTYRASMTSGAQPAYLSNEIEV